MKIETAIKEAFRYTVGTNKMPKKYILGALYPYAKEFKGELPRIPSAKPNIYETAAYFVRELNLVD